jgi:hypothetical protein
MKIAVFTSNQPRHVALIEKMAGIAEVVYAVQECNTVFPGKVADFFRKSEVMQRYFGHVMAAEEAVFGRPRFAPGNVRQLPVKMGDVSQLAVADLEPALACDRIIVFGASFIRGPLCQRLVERQAVNIHMGLSPFYRGSSTNFWAMYDGRPDLVGATVHRLTAGLDSGDIHFHALPAADAVDPFVFGMRAVRSAHLALAEALRTGALLDEPAVPQDRSLQLRYTRNADFTDAVAADYLARLPNSDELLAGIAARSLAGLVRPRIL